MFKFSYISPRQTFTTLAILLFIGNLSLFIVSFLYIQSRYTNDKISTSLNRIARYNDVCLVENHTNTDWYRVVQAEIDHHHHRKSNQTDLAYIRLPNYSSKEIAINNIYNSLFLYSAFARSNQTLTEKLSKQDSFEITVIAIAKQSVYCPEDEQVKWNLYCVFDDAVLRSVARIDCIPEHHGLPYAVVLLVCHAQLRYRKVHIEALLAEQFILEIPHSKSQLIEIIYPTKRNNSAITVCVRPLFSQINIFNLLEFIAYYQAEGITDLTFYYYKFAQQSSQSETFRRTVQFVNFLSRLSNVHVHSFQLPASVAENIHAGGQLAAMHDCLMRYSHSVQIHVDIDEFVSVRNGEKIHFWIQKQLGSPVAYKALCVANVLHCHEFNVNRSVYYEFQANQNLPKGEKFYYSLNDESVKSVLIVRNNVYYQQTVWQHTIRSKMILLYPRLVAQLGIHNVWKFHPSTDHNLYSVLNVDPSLAIVRHYRWCCGITQPFFFNIFNFKSLDDKVMTDFEPIQSSDKSMSFEDSQSTNSIESQVLNNFQLYFSMFNTTNLSQTRD